MSQVARARNECTPVAHPIGDDFVAEVMDCDLAEPLSDETFRALYQMFFQRKVLVFRDQNFGDDAHSQFARHFGKLQVHVLNQYHSNNPEIIYLE